MIISLSGAGGSGKSTIAIRLADKLGWPRYYMGGLRREVAAQRGLTLAEYNKLGESNPATDMEVDEYQKKLGETEDNFVIEGRTSWYFIPHSLKIYLDVDADEGARRVFGHLQEKNDRNEDEGLNSVEAVRQSIAQRLESDNLRYRKYYGIEGYNRENYDFYLNTTNFSADEVFERVYDFVLSRLDKR
ncbi:MAG: cytidylate kinase family protein [Patescibacteria group bacterium]|nr:cytidylate kinase family protein [Patescibacteria group bacterium]